MSLTISSKFSSASARISLHGVQSASVDFSKGCLGILRSLLFLKFILTGKLSHRIPANVLLQNSQNRNRKQEVQRHTGCPLSPSTLCFKHFSWTNFILIHPSCSKFPEFSKLPKLLCLGKALSEKNAQQNPKESVCVDGFVGHPVLCEK